MKPSGTIDVLVIGAGMVGAACAYYAAQAGLRVAVLDRGPIAGGTTSNSEGNLLVSDKLPGPDLRLGLFSLRLWRELGREVGRGAIELESKGGLTVAATIEGMNGLRTLAERQRPAGVDAIEVAADELSKYEPHISPELAGGVYYRQDLQVQPMLAAAHLLRASGVPIHCGAPVTGFEKDRSGRIAAALTSNGDRFAAGTVVNAAGVWGGEIAALAGVDLPVTPRRGFVLVTEPLCAPGGSARGIPAPIRHKVYAAEYVSNVVSEEPSLQTSAVVEGTRAGTVLIGASRERVGFDPYIPLDVLRRLAAQAIGMFPFLAEVSVLRSYRGYRPYTPDHAPIIGPDPRVPGLYHACGHEGAGIGLAPATGALIAAQLTGDQIEIDPSPFRPERFA